MRNLVEEGNYCEINNNTEIRRYLKGETERMLIDG